MSEKFKVGIHYLPEKLMIKSDEDFERMFSLKPEQKHQIQLKDCQIEVPRYQQNYLNTPKISQFLSDDSACNYKYRTSYMFSGFDDSNNNEPLPAIFQPYFDFVKSYFKDCDFNQVSVNWYNDGKDYIAFHRDCEEYMKGDKNIAILTFNEKEEVPRDMVFKPDDKSVENITIPLTHGKILLIEGETQTYYRHGIMKSENGKRRISMSFRQFE